MALKSESEPINMIQRTIVSEVDGSASIENGEHAGVVEASSVRGAVLDLEVETKGVSRSDFG